jgi:HEAT repeat protein
MLLPVSSGPARAQQAGDAKDAAAAPADTANAGTAEATSQPAEAKPAPGTPGGEIRGEFVNFLHFAMIGRFDYAQAHARALLQRPDVNPLSKEAAETLVQLSQERPRAIETLIILINNSTIGEDAGKIMALIREAHRRKRMDPGHIVASIQMLAGEPTDQATGLERLIDSGEYAVPQMLSVLADTGEKTLHPYVVRALPRLGKPAVNPLTAALGSKDEIVQRCAAEALGRLGYPQALPYLKRIAADGTNPAVRDTAVAAVRQIVVADPRIKDAPAVQLFRDLAESYFAEEDSLVPDSNQPRANVWVVDGVSVKPIDVPRRIFCMVMSMQCCEASLGLSKDQPGTFALWLAANFRRESRLGLDVQTTDLADVDDATRPAKFMRGVYYAQQAGPDCCGLVLARGLKDLDRPVVLGAIAGMAGTAGPANLEGKMVGLPEAIRFPDQLVRIRAALVLARLLPTRPFPGADEVVPVLTSAFAIAGQPAWLVIEPDKKLADALAADLAKSGARVVVADRLELGLARAAEQVSQLDGIFLASDAVNPDPVAAVGMLAHDERFAMAPVVLAVKEGGMLVAEKAAQADDRIGRVLVVNDGNPGKSVADLLVAKAGQVAVNYGYRPLTAEDGKNLSLEAMRGLQRIARFSSSSVFDARMAEPALVRALNTHPSEEVRVGATRVLALLNTATAQPAIAAVALSAQQTPTLRLAAFGSLAESARELGNRLDDKLNKALVEAVKSEPDAKLRTAASEALGAAIHMPAELAVEAVLHP